MAKSPGRVNAAKRHRHRFRKTRCFNSIGHERLAPGECELRGQELVGRSLPRRPNIGLRGTAALPFLESVPDVANKLKAPNTADEKFEDVVKSAQDAAVLVLVY